MKYKAKKMSVSASLYKQKQSIGFRDTGSEFFSLFKKGNTMEPIGLSLSHMYTLYDASAAYDV